MTKLEFASAWRLLRSILMAYLEYVKTRIAEKTARDLVTPEMFLCEGKVDTPEWQAWIRTQTARKVAFEAMLDAADNLDCSDVGELLREDAGPYELDVDSDDEPAGKSEPHLPGVLHVHDEPEPETTAYERRQTLLPPQLRNKDDHGSQQEPGNGSGGGKEAAAETD